MNFVKFIRTVFLTEHLQWLLLIIWGRESTSGTWKFTTSVSVMHSGMKLQRYYWDSLSPLFNICDQRNQKHSSQICTQPAITSSKIAVEILEQRCEICSKLTIKPPKRRQWHVSHLCSSVSIVNLQVNTSWGCFAMSSHFVFWRADEMYKFLTCGVISLYLCKLGSELLVN